MIILSQKWITFIVSTVYLVHCDADSSETNYTAVFSQHQHWDGYYEYNNTQNYCYLFVHSTHYLKKDGLMATFTDTLGATVEMEGSSPGANALEVVFSTYTMFKDVARFPIDFTMRGALSLETNGWWFRATVTVPDNGRFGRIDLQQTDSKFGPPTSGGKNEPWRYFVIIGIPVILAVVGAIAIVGLFVWAKKKGYIRHVAENYKSLHNPVRYRAGDESVHI